MIRVGWLSDWTGATTGFATVARNVLGRLQSMGDLDIRQLAIGFNPVRETLQLERSTFKVDMYEQIARAKDTWDIEASWPHGVHAYEVKGENAWGQDCLEAFIQKFKIDVMVINSDLWMSAHTVVSEEWQNHFGCRFIYYQPIDGTCPDGKLPHHAFITKDSERKMIPWADLMHRQHHTVLYGEWAKKLYMHSLPEDWRESAEARCSVIPHGVDLKIFTPFPMHIARASFGFPPEKRTTGGAFVVGMCATNQSRKNWPGIARTMAVFMDQHPEAVFFPWVNFWPRMDGWDLARLFGAYLPMGRVIQFEPLQRDDYLDADVVARFYASLNVHVLWHRGEGCGLPHLEAQACGRPSLAVNYSGIVDYFSDPRLRMRAYSKDVVAQGNCILRPEGDEQVLLQKLNELYRSDELRVELGKKGVAYARKHWDWGDISAKWYDLIHRVYEEGQHESVATS
jgi:glycosyltransferase involved in cell wall biosynthesis